MTNFTYPGGCGWAFKIPNETISELLNFCGFYRQAGWSRSTWKKIEETAKQWENWVDQFHILPKKEVNKLSCYVLPMMVNIRAGEPSGKSHRVMIRDSVHQWVWVCAIWEWAFLPKNSQEAWWAADDTAWWGWGIWSKAFTTVALKGTHNFPIVSQDNTMKVLHVCLKKEQNFDRIKMDDLKAKTSLLHPGDALPSCLSAFRVSFMMNIPLSSRQRNFGSFFVTIVTFFTQFHSIFSSPCGQHFTLKCSFKVILFLAQWMHSGYNTSSWHCPLRLWDLLL